MDWPYSFNSHLYAVPAGSTQDGAGGVNSLTWTPAAENKAGFQWWWVLPIVGVLGLAGPAAATAPQAEHLAAPSVGPLDIFVPVFVHIAHARGGYLKRKVGTRPHLVWASAANV